MKDKFALEMTEAINNADLETVKFLLNHQGIDINNKLDKFNHTPLHIAAYNEANILFGLSNNLVGFCLESGANPNIQDQLGNTPLHISSLNNRGYFYMDKLIKSGAELNIKNNKEETPLHIAAYYNKQYNSTLSKLIESGANPNIQDNNGNTALHIITRKEINYKLDENEEDSADYNKFSPEFLTLLEMNSHLDNKNKINLEHLNNFKFAAACLFEKNANPNIQDKHGNTPLHIAAFNRDEIKVRILLENGANLNLKNNKKITPLDLIFNDKNLTNKLSDILEKNFYKKFEDYIQEKIKQFISSENNIKKNISEISDSQYNIFQKMCIDDSIKLSNNLKSIGVVRNIEKINNIIKKNLLNFEETKEDLVNSSIKNIDRGEEAYYNTGQNSGSSSESNYLDLVEEQRKEKQNQQRTQTQFEEQTSFQQ